VSEKWLCYVGDFAHHPVFLLQKPLTEFKYDTDPKQSAQSRVKMLSMLADKRFKKEPWGKQPGLFPLESVTGIARARAVCRSVGAAVTAAEERPKPIVQTNFKHLNLAARRESVPPERPRSKREVI
jgi:hypothetical protein